jgi:hypothetical protein
MSAYKYGHTLELTTEADMILGKIGRHMILSKVMPTLK